MILNMMPIVVAAIALGYALSEDDRREHRYVLFAVSLAGVIPLCFTVGSLISRIAAVHKSSLVSRSRQSRLVTELGGLAVWIGTFVHSWSLCGAVAVPPVDAPCAQW